MARASRPKQVGALRHDAKRANIPTAEMQSFFQREEDHSPLPPEHHERRLPLAEGERRERDPDRDPQLLWSGMRITLNEAQRRQLAETGEIEIGEAQLVWRGKDTQDWSDLIVQTPPLYIQEKIHPKAIIDDLRRQSAVAEKAATDEPSLFADFNGVPRDVAAEFYQHEANWSNRMISGDSLAVMASLAERERLKGKVQCIYFDPPYGIRFNSNWQVSTRISRRQRRPPDRHQPRARAGQGLPRYLEGRHPLLPDLSARPSDCRPRPLDRQRLDLRADRRRECAPGARGDGRGVWGRTIT